MNELDTRIKGHLFEIKERYDDIFELEEYFEFTPEELEKTAKDLKNCVEMGVLEYKKRIVSSVYTFLENLKYDSRGFEKLETYLPPLTALVYTALAQRLIAKGTLRNGSEQKNEVIETTTITEEELPIKDILSDVQKRIKNDPAMENDPKIKSILLQIRRYRAELEKKTTLEPNILPDKREAFEGNYKKVFDEIFTKIREIHYSLEKKFTLMLPKEVHRSLKIKSAELERPMTTLIIDAIKAAYKI